MLVHAYTCSCRAFLYLSVSKYDSNIIRWYWKSSPYYTRTFYTLIIMIPITLCICTGISCIDHYQSVTESTSLCAMYFLLCSALFLLTVEEIWKHLKNNASWVKLRTSCLWQTTMFHDTFKKTFFFFFFFHKFLDKSAILWKNTVMLY